MNVLLHSPTPRAPFQGSRVTMTKAKLKGWAVECYVQWEYGSFMAHGGQEHSTSDYVFFGYAFAETRGQAISAFLHEPEDAGYGPESTWLDFRAKREPRLDGHEDKFETPKNIPTWYYDGTYKDHPDYSVLSDLGIIGANKNDG